MYFNGMSVEENQSLLHLPNSKPNNERESRRYFWHYNVCPCLPSRYAVVAIAFLGFVNVYALRTNLSMAIVAMVNSSANASTHFQYNWSSTQQGWVLSSFYYGYLITQIPGGYLADIFGGKYILGIGVLMTSLLTILTPLAAELHIIALIVLRVLEGFFEGVTYPALASLLGKWSPPNERSIMTTMTVAGSQVGTIISFPISALLCEYGFAGGWPSVFYVFGGLGVIWFFLWLYLGFDSPATHPRISEAERKYIETSIEEEGARTIKEKVPWFNIMTSSAVWAIIIAYVCSTWGFYTLLTCIPSYYNDVLQLSLGKNLVQNGVFSAIPYIGFAVAVLIAGQLADCMIRRKVNVAFVRKLFTTTAFVVAAFALLVINYIGSSKIGTIALVTVSVAFSGLLLAGPNINQLDIAPQFAGVLMGISNMAGTIPGIVAPFVAKIIAHTPALGETDAATYREEWKEVFIIAAEVYIFGAIMYIILGKGERQWWAKGDTLPTNRTENYTNSIIIMKPESTTDSKYTIQKP